MSNVTIDEAKLERMKECTNAQEVMQILAEDGFELTDEQLEAVTGGVATEWPLEKLIESFGDVLADLFPEGADPKTVWGNLPTFAGH